MNKVSYEANCLYRTSTDENAWNLQKKGDIQRKENQADPTAEPEVIQPYDNVTYIEIKSPAYKVTYKIDDDNSTEKYQAENTEITLPLAKVKEGAVFAGWNDGKTTYPAETKVTITKDVTFTAQWEHTVTFDANGGKYTTATAPTVETKEGKLLSMPTEQPTNDGYTFKGWFTAKDGGTEVTTDTPFTENTTVYAQWTKNEEEPGEDPETTGVYTITFDANGGKYTTAAAPTVDTKDGKLPAMPTQQPTRSGYKFKGWYTLASGGTQVTTDTAFSEAATVYAQWKRKDSSGSSSSSSGSSGGSSSGGSSTDSATSDADKMAVVNEDGTAAVDKDHKADIAKADIQKLADEGESLTLTNGSQKIIMNADALKEVLEAMGNDDQAETVLAPISDTVYEKGKEQLEKDPDLSEVGGKENWLVFGKDQEVFGTLQSFNEPVQVSFDLSKQTIKDPSKLTLVKYETAKDGTVTFKKLGGAYDPQSGSFTAYITEPGTYGVVASETLQQISLKLGDNEIYINGELYPIDVAPQAFEGTTMVPLRVIAQALGAEIKWDNAKKEAVITLNGKTITVGKAQGAMIKDGRTLVPLRYISEAFNSTVQWVPSKKEVRIIR